MVRSHDSLTTLAHPGDPALTGSRLPKPRRIALLLLFAFEVVINITLLITIITILILITTRFWKVDTLEVSLREQEDLVDHIFLVQMMKTMMITIMRKKTRTKMKTIMTATIPTKTTSILTATSTMLTATIQQQQQR